MLSCSSSSRASAAACAAPPRRADLLGNEVDNPVAMSSAQGGLLAGRPQLLGAVLADRLEQAIASGAAALVGHHQRFVDQLREQIEHVAGVKVVAGADGLGGLEVQPPAKTDSRPSSGRSAS